MAHDPRMEIVTCDRCENENLASWEQCRFCSATLPSEGAHVFERPRFDIGQEWAAPGDNQDDVWKLFFHDRDCGEMLFRGPEAEAEAWAAWDRYAPHYNVNLFRQVKMKERPPLSQHKRGGA